MRTDDGQMKKEGDYDDAILLICEDSCVLLLLATNNIAMM
jgi:hypothetical protein